MRRDHNLNETMPAHFKPVRTASPRQERGERGAGLAHTSAGAGPHPLEQPKPRNMLSIWKGIGRQGNDNAVPGPSGSKIGLWLAFVMMMGVAVTLDASQLATSAALYGEGAIFRQAMDISPGAVGFVLNKINVGE